MKTLKLNLTMKEKLNNIIFHTKTKDQFIEETLSSLSGLLDDVFTGNDENKIKKEFPPDIQIEDIGIQLRNVSLLMESKEFITPSIEVSIDLILEKMEYEIGTYTLIFDENGEQVDEVLNIN